MADYSWIIGVAALLGGAFAWYNARRDREEAREEARQEREEARRERANQQDKASTEATATHGQELANIRRDCERHQKWNGAIQETLKKLGESQVRTQTMLEAHLKTHQ